MKTIRYIFPIIAVLFLASCEVDDDGFNNAQYIQAQNLVTIGVQPTYAVNDLLNVAAVIPNLLTEEGQATPLDIRKTTGDAEMFEFSYVLEKKSVEGTWEFVDLTGNFDQIQGEANVGSFVQGFATYNPNTNSYLFSGGIRLAQTGEYRLSFGYNSPYPDRVEIVSDSKNDNIILNIFSTVNSIDSGGFYSFTVN